MNLFFLCVIGYLIGSIPTGFLLTKFIKGIDIRNIGSSSTGATNVLRTGDKRLAFLTLFIDAFKGWLSAILLMQLATADLQAFISIFFCLIGHAYPIWLSFNGGKGVATSAGIFLALDPVFAIVAIVIWALVAKFTKISSIASLSMSLSFVILTIVDMLFYEGEPTELCFISIVFLFLIFTHYENIKRIIRGEETSPSSDISQKN